MGIETGTAILLAGGLSAAGVAGSTIVGSKDKKKADPT